VTVVNINAVVHRGTSRVSGSKLKVSNPYSRPRGPRSLGAETAAFGYLRERLVGTAGPQGAFGYPATCAVVERRSRTLKSLRGFSFPIY